MQTADTAEDASHLMTDESRKERYAPQSRARPCRPPTHCRRWLHNDRRQASRRKSGGVGKSEEYPLPAEIRNGFILVHDANVARFHGAVLNHIQSLRRENPQIGATEIRDTVSRNISFIVDAAKLDYSAYQALGKESGEYGKFLLFSSQSLNDAHQSEAPFCIQLLYFEKAQATPIHDHPCECASLVVLGSINERLYRSLEEITEENQSCTGILASKSSKQYRGEGSRSEVKFQPFNEPHSIKNSGSSPAISLHIYAMDGMSEGQTRAVKNIFTKISLDANMCQGDLCWG